MGYFRCVMVLAMVLPLASLARADGIRFLPDDAQIACRAILPQCFTREGWHRLCRNDPTMAKAHRVACRQAADGLKDAVD